MKKIILSLTMAVLGSCLHMNTARADAKTVDIAVDYEFKDYDDCVAKLHNSMRVAVMLTTNSNGQLVEIGQAETYCRGLFPAVGTSTSTRTSTKSYRPD